MAQTTYGKLALTDDTVDKLLWHLQPHPEEDFDPLVFVAAWVTSNMELQDGKAKNLTGLLERLGLEQVRTRQGLQIARKKPKAEKKAQSSLTPEPAKEAAGGETQG